MTTKFFEKLSSNLNDLLNNSNEHNVIIEVGQVPNNQTFKAHSIILSSRCSYFKNKLSSITCDEDKIKKIKQANISVKVFDIIIKYIYSGVISLEKVDTSAIFDLLITSNEFGLKELVEHIQLFFIENHASWLRLNFSLVYQTSIKDDNFNELQHFCANIIAKYPNIIFDSDEFITLSEKILIFVLKLDDLQMDEGTIWDYVIKWGIAQNPSLNFNLEQWSDADFLTLKNTLQNCLPLVRYFQIPGKEVFKKVRPYHKILELTLWEDILSKFMSPDQAINYPILPPRNILPKSVPLRDNLPISISVQQPLNSSINIDNMKEIESDNISTLKGRAEQHYKAYKHEEALADFNKLLKIEPNNSWALKCRGDIYRQMDKYEESLTDLNKSLEIEPNDAWVLNRRGDTYRTMRKYEEALAEYNKSLEIRPNDTWALKYRGETYRQMHKYKEALADLNKSLEIKPNDSWTLKCRGEIYRLMYKYDEALTDVTKSLEIKPNDSQTLKCRGEIYRNMHKYEEALSDFNKSLEIKPNDSQTLTYRGETYRQMHKYEEALADLNKSLKIKPNNETALKFLEKLNKELTKK